MKFISKAFGKKTEKLTITIRILYFKRLKKSDHNIIIQLAGIKSS